MANALEIGIWLRKARQRARLKARKAGRRDFSIEKVARRLDVVERTVRQWEKGINPPPADHFLTLAALYEVDPRELMAPRRSERTVEIEGGIDVPHPSTRSVAAPVKKRRQA